jgi:hypothetical protein
MTSKNGTSCHSSNSSTENEVKLQIQNDVKKDELVVQMESIHVNVEKVKLIILC